MTSGRRDLAKTIFDAGLAAADPYRLLSEGLEDAGTEFRFGEESLLEAPGPHGRLRIFGAGKAVASLARAVEEKLGKRDLSGRVVVKHGHGQTLSRVDVEEGGHPLPDEAGLAATARVLEDVKDGRPEDRIFLLLTGGASALLVAPAPGLKLDDKIRTTDLLLRSGATIRELNALRKHLSAIKGGRFLERLSPARVLAFVVSDVIGDDLSSIGSGPAVGDPTTFGDCLGILELYHLNQRVPERVLAHLKRGAAGELPETPKPGDAVLANARHVIVASNRLSLEAAASEARRRGLAVEIFLRDMEGQVHERARAFAKRLAERAAGRGEPVVLLAGGELTLEVKGSGKGGRNQEFALVAARELRRARNIVVLSAGTDGTDGPTDAAGAFADGTTWSRAHELGLDPERALADNDSYPLFDRLGDLLLTGPTGTNVNDLVIGLANVDES